MPSNNETTTKFKVDISDLKKGIQEANRQIRLANAEFKAAASGMDDWSKSTNGVSSKISQLEKVLSSQNKVLDSYKKQLALIVDEYGANSKEADEMRIKIANQQAAVNKTTSELNKYENQLSELKNEQEKATDSTEKLDDAIDDVGGSAKDAGKGGFTVLKGALANLVADGIELALRGLKRLGEEIVNVGKQSIANYAEYEQLVGGVETLFKDSADIVQGYAQNAFKTAGLSANNYMETVTSFSASLLQGLGGDTAKAAKIADLAITDMSDNANKMGTDMSLLQNAYQGFAKQNFTMLDNLKLGYGGTQAEMARLINESGVLGDSMEVTAETVKNVSFDKMIEAIHVVQTEMGITGTTAKEAASTIEGSKNAMQAAWQNLLTGLADEDADLDQLFENLITSAETYLKNILPRVETLVDRVVDFIGEKLREKFPEAMETLSEVFGVVKEVFQWVMDNGNTIVGVLVSIGAAIVAWNIANVVTGIISFVKAIQAMGAATAVAAAKQWLLNTALLANPIGLIIAAVAALVAAFIYFWNTSEEFRNFWIGLWETIKEAAMVAWEAISGFFADAWAWIQEKWAGLTEFFSDLWQSIKDIFSTIAQWINDNVFQPIIEFFQPVIQFFTDAWNIIKELAQGCWEAIKLIWSAVSGWFNQKVIEPVKNFFSKMWENVKNAASTAWNFIKGVWAVVSGWFNDKIVSPITNFFSGMWDKVKTGAKLAWEGIKAVFSVVADWFEDKFRTAWEKVKAVFSAGGTIFDGIKEGITSAFKSVVNAIIRGINKVIAIPFNAINNMLDKIRNVSILGAKPFEKLVSRFNVPQIPELAKGGVLGKGQIGLLEGNGAEAVVPLDRNTKWIRATARDLKSALAAEGILTTGGNKQSVVNNNYNFTQNNTSPKALSRFDLYRQTKNQLAFLGGVTNV